MEEAVAVEDTEADGVDIIGEEIAVMLPKGMKTLPKTKVVKETKGIPREERKDEDHPEEDTDDDKGIVFEKFLLKNFKNLSLYLSFLNHMKNIVC